MDYPDQVRMTPQDAPRYPDPAQRPGYCPACIAPLDFTPMGSGFAQCTRCGWRGVLACPECGAAFSERGPWFYWCSVEQDGIQGQWTAAQIAARCAVPIAGAGTLAAVERALGEG